MDDSASPSPRPAGARGPTATPEHRQGVLSADAWERQVRASDRTRDLEMAVARIAATRWGDQRRIDTLVQHLQGVLHEAEKRFAPDEDLRALQVAREAKELIADIRRGASQDASATLLDRESSGRNLPPRPDLTFGAFLRSAYLDPFRPTPLSDLDQAAVQTMEAFADALDARYRERPSPGLVSIVMPTYDRMATLPRAIESVRAQTYQDWELLVVDDGSTDGTADHVTAIDDPRVRFLPQAENAGVSKARNAGLARAQGSWIAYLDSDNAWDPRYLAVLIHQMADTGTRVGYTGQWIWQTKGALDDAEATRTLDGVRFAPFNRSLLENRNYLDLNCVAHVRSLTDQVGGFNEELPRLVDWDLLLRLTAVERPVAVPCLLSTYEFGTAGDQLTHSHPVRATTRTMDEQTLCTELLELPLPQDVARVAEGAPLHGLMERPAPQDPDTEVTVLVVDPDDLGRLETCLAALARHGDGVAEVCVRDGHELPGLAAAIAAAAAEQAFPVRVASSGQPAKDSRPVVVMTGRTVVTPRWLDGLLEALGTSPRVGVVVPRRVVLPGAEILDDAALPYHKRYREVDTAAIGDNVLDPVFDAAVGLVELSAAPPGGCALFAAAVADEVLGAARYADPALGAQAVERVRHLRGGKVIYAPRSKCYELV